MRSQRKIIALNLNHNVPTTSEQMLKKFWRWLGSSNPTSRQENNGNTATPHIPGQPQPPPVWPGYPHPYLGLHPPVQDARNQEFGMHHGFTHNPSVEGKF